MNNVLIKVINSLVIVSVFYTQLYAHCVLLEDGCSLFKYNTTETKRICIEKKEVWDCTTSKTIQVGCNKYKREENCSGFITFPKDIYETKDYQQAFGQAIAKVGAFGQIKNIWSGWKGECEYGEFTDFSWLKNPMFLLSAATSLMAGGAFGSGVKNAYTAVSTAGSEAESEVTGYLSGGLLGNANYASCMANAGLSPSNLLSYSLEDKKPNDNSILDQKKPVLYIRKNEKSSFNNIAKTDNIKYTSEGSDAGGEYVQVNSVSDAINVKSMQCDGTLGAVGGAMDVVSGVSSGSVGGYLQAADGIAKIASAFHIIGAINPIVGFLIQLAIQTILSFSNCNACTSIKCARKVDQSGLQLKTNQFLNRQMCHYIKTTCSWKASMFGCLRHKNYYCCYDQILTRIFVEQAKLQLAKNWNSCNDISYDDLNKLSFRQCGPHENQHKDKCMDFTEFIAVLQRQINKKLNKNDLGQAAAAAIGGSVISPN